MGTKRTKVNSGMLQFIPKPINFSELEKMEDGRDGEMKFTEFGDEGLGMEKVEQDIHFEELVVQMLYVLDGNERIIFLYQLLRDYGYQIDHTSFAKTLHLKRSRYMDILSMVRLKTYLVVKGYRESQEAQSKQTKAL